MELACISAVRAAALLDHWRALAQRCDCRPGTPGRPLLAVSVAAAAVDCNHASVAQLPPLRPCCSGFDAVTGLGTPNVNGLILAAMSEAPPVVPPYAWLPTPAHEPLSIGAIAGIVAGCIVAIIVVTGVFMCLRNRCCVSRAEGSVVDTSPGKHGYSY